MSLRYSRISARYQKGAEWLQSSIDFVNSCFKEGNLFLTHHRNLQRAIVTICCQDRCSGHLDIQNAKQLFPDPFILYQVAQHGGVGHELIHSSISFNALMEFGDTPATNKGGPALISSFGIDA